MDSLYSVDEVSDDFWPFPATEPEIFPDLSRSSSEWALQRLLEEVCKYEQVEEDKDDVVEIEKPQHHHHRHPHPHPHPPPYDLTPMNPIDFDCHQDLLKRQLELACAAVARECSVKSQKSVCIPDDQSQALMLSQLRSQVIGPWNSFPMPQVKADGEPLGVPSIPDLQTMSGIQTMQATSGSSREQSDDDELEGETETTENMEPADEKRGRRKLSNRESAKRSRRRKQEHLSELETQAARLRIEKSSLLKLLNEWDQKSNEAAVDNRVLKADIETLRAKVMMVEDKVKRVTGLNLSPFQPLSDIPSVGMPFSSNRSADVNGSMPDSNHLIHGHAPATLHYRV